MGKLFDHSLALSALNGVAEGSRTRLKLSTQHSCTSLNRRQKRLSHISRLPWCHKGRSGSPPGAWMLSLGGHLGGRRLTACQLNALCALLQLVPPLIETYYKRLV
ncbi:hypothetical protein BDW62DRAFT_49874 [Aspergillus aurantiobrunneus]